MSGNPFDPLGGGAATSAPSYGSPNAYSYGVPASMSPMAQQYPSPQEYSTPQQQQQQYQGISQQHPGTSQQQASAPVTADAWGVQPLQGQPPYGQQQPQSNVVQDPWGAEPQHQQPSYSQQQPGHVQVYQSAAPAVTNYDPFVASPAPSNQLIISQQQSNPYGGFATPAQMGYAAQSLVPVAAQASPWGMTQNQAYGAPTGAAYDPFSASVPQVQMQFPTPAPAPPPAPVQQENPFGDFALPAAPSPAPAPAPALPKDPPQEVQIVASQERQLQQYAAGDYPQRQSVSNSQAIVPVSPTRNPYAGEIARRAPPGASPLPKAELVKKSGYVLSRISFRTIVMKKWKQSYWVQYGSHTMLWFRSQSDFDDWLNNPYHTQAQRNFLIKLAVNFVHDLYKPNVRGYQVTQCRVKPYGNKMVRQFKLERWMDYGPTIAAAFGSYDPKEVNALREAIVECMRNTPLDNGIRATGAVRQGREEDRDYDDRQEDSRSHQSRNGASHHEEKNQRFSSGGTLETSRRMMELVCHCFF